MITYKEKASQLFPGAIDKRCFCGMSGCPSNYFIGFDSRLCGCNSNLNSDQLCRQCWNQEYKGEELKDGTKI